MRSKEKRITYSARKRERVGGWKRGGGRKKEKMDAGRKKMTKYNILKQFSRKRRIQSTSIFHNIT